MKISDLSEKKHIVWDDDRTYHLEPDEGPVASHVNLDRLKALADAATLGPWEATYEEADRWTSITGQSHDGLVCPEVATCEGEPGDDSAFIAALDPDTVRALIADARRVQEAEAKLEQVRAFAQQQHDEIIGRYNLTGAANSHRAGFAAACSDILAIIDQTDEY